MPKGRFDELADDIYGLGVTIIFTIIMIYIIFEIAKSIIGQLPALIGSVVAGFVLLYVYTTNQAIRESINNWIKDISKKTNTHAP